MDEEDEKEEEEEMHFLLNEDLVSEHADFLFSFQINQYLINTCANNDNNNNDDNIKMNNNKQPAGFLLLVFVCNKKLIIQFKRTNK